MAIVHRRIVQVLMHLLHVISRYIMLSRMTFRLTFLSDRWLLEKVSLYDETLWYDDDEIFHITCVHL